MSICQERKYKPLSDDEILATEMGAKWWNTSLLRVVEQAKRANALAEAANSAIEHYGYVSDVQGQMKQLAAALAAYLGEE